MKMNIACVTDDNYAPYCGIMLTSLFESNKEHTFSVYILTRGISKENTAKFEQLASLYNSEISIIAVDGSIFANCPIREGDHVTVETYYRLALPTLLPNDVNKILYLDVDIIVDKPIDELYNLDITEVALSACIDAIGAYDQDIATRLGIEIGRYFNAGVILINLEYWRSHHVEERCFEVIRSKPEALITHDQDTLNTVLCKEINYFDLQFNYQPLCLHPYLFPTINETIRHQYIMTSNAPAIIHYIGIDKPWKRLCACSYREVWMHYKKISLWKGHPLQRNYKTIRQLVGWERRMLEVRLGLRKPWFVVKEVKYHQ